MIILKINSQNESVALLRESLAYCGYDIGVSTFFDDYTENTVRDFQTVSELRADGIVGISTWKAIDAKLKKLDITDKLTESDFADAASALGADVAAVKAVSRVETGARGGFFSPGRPVILFEGQKFWQQLWIQEIDVEAHLSGNEDILYQVWSNNYYLGGIQEYTRLERAREINEPAALCSASWGMFQIMGFNYKLCDCRDIYEFTSLCSQNEREQLMLFVKLLQRLKLDRSLREHQWAEFARGYNGFGYERNHYDEKLSQAYHEFSNPVRK